MDSWKSRDQKTPGLIQKINQVLTNMIFPATDPEPVDRLRLPGRYVAFIGDSYCSAIAKTTLHLWQAADPWPSTRKDSFHPQLWTHGADTDKIVHPSFVADRLGLNLAPYGFGGRSWWWSWNRFWRDWHADLDRLEAIVFMHTHPCRINNSVDPFLPHITHMPSLADLPSEKIQAMKTHFVHLEDQDFQFWAQRQFFRYIRDTLAGIKIINFFSMNWPTTETCQSMPGMIYNCPLQPLSAAELEGWPDQPWPLHDQADIRYNHFNDHNNQALGQLICDSINDYRPGVYDLPYDKFYQWQPKKFRKSLARVLEKYTHKI